MPERSNLNKEGPILAHTGGYIVEQTWWQEQPEAVGASGWYSSLPPLPGIGSRHLTGSTTRLQTSREYFLH